MASTINADNGVVSGSSGVKTTADTSGVLALQSNGTTGLTLNTSLALGVGSGNSTGSSGQVLTSAGAGAAPAWTDPSAGGSADFVATGTIPNGATVALRSDGTVEVVDGYAQSAATGSATQYFAGTRAQNMAVCGVGSNKIAIAFVDVDTANATKIVIGTVSGTTITFGTVQTVTSTNSSFRVGITYVPGTNTVIVAMGNTQGNCYAGTISGTTVSFGSAAQFSSSTDAYALFYNPTVGKAYVVFQNAPSTRTECRVITLSGTSISYGTTAIVSNYSPAETLGVAFDDGNQVLYIAGKAADASNYGFVAAASITSTSASLISETTFTAYAVSTANVSIAYDSVLGKAFACCINSAGTGLRIGVVTLSGGSLSVASTDFNSLVSTGLVCWVAWDDYVKKVFVAYGAEAGLFYATVDFDGGVVSLQDTISLTISTTGSTFLYAANDSTSGANILAYTGSGRNGTAFAMRLAGSNTNVDKFIGIASEAIASGATGSITIISGTNASQSGLVIGTDYWLNPNGSLSASVTPYGHAGFALSATELLITDTRTTLSPLALNATGTPSSSTFLRGDGSWSTPNAGAMVFITSVTASASSTVTITGLSGAYIAYKVIASDVAPGTDGVRLELETSADGSTWRTAYDHTSARYIATAITVTSGTASAKAALTGTGLFLGNATSETSAFELTLSEQADSGKRTKWFLNGVFGDTAGNAAGGISAGQNDVAGVTTAIRFSMNTGTIATGTFCLYGILGN